ncbi:glycerophosphodiester phosphodiesterase [Brevibacterium jeotgali]|uniref:Glycerophosphoryl diester phosphodiesterase n=1 Tax=Brevibacterium jeotgali TaxID=1262550 RepID=A0A2H1L0Y8_9MICO|nr:glycerophosphodiester phosphodiesterase family protein [Brevibacterium jeotgali]TWC02141.1 glycerophosphoryl diester phosphodiesterase [Brevibacterium jeotgali]SMY10509.1 glycerophosphoryl diester phosphodiesterase [Brevibacterium jeotgali]
MTNDKVRSDPLTSSWAERVRNAAFAHEDISGGPLVTDRPWVIAHRGYSGAAPENTLAAVDAARMVGADWIEVDLHVSGDGTPTVIHDQSVDRTTDGSGAVGRLDDDTLSRLDAGSWAGPGFAGQRLPKLDTLLRDVSTNGGRLLLELKGEWSPGAVASVAGSIIDEGMADRTVVQSFSVATLAFLRDIAPLVERCLLRTVPREDDLAVVDDLQALAYNPSVRGFFMRRGVVDQFLDAGCGMFVWTVDDPTSWEKLFGAGVHGIITNLPATLQGYLAAKYEPV